MLEVDAEVASRLRQWAPECIRDPFLRAIGERGYFDRRVSAAIDFTEACVRYFVAILAPEGEGTPALETLKSKLERPSLGDWLQAADALAKKIVRQPEALAWPAARALRTQEGKQSEVIRGLEVLVQVRNDLAHTGRLDTTSDRALQQYEREMVPALHAVFAGLSCVEHLVIHAFDDVDREVGRSTRLLRFAGGDAQVLALESPRVRPLEPLLIGLDGRTQELGPFMAVRVGAELRTHLLDRIERGKGAFFIDPKGFDALPAPDAWSRRWLSAQQLTRPLVTAADSSLARIQAVPTPSLPLRPLARPKANHRRRRILWTSAGLVSVVAAGAAVHFAAHEPPAIPPSKAPPASVCTCQGVAPRQVLITCTKPAADIDLAIAQGTGVAAVRTAWKRHQAGDRAGARRLAEEAVVAFDCEVRRRRYDLAKQGVECPENPARTTESAPACSVLARPIGDRAWSYNLAGDLGRAENGQRDLLALQSKPELRAASYQQLAELRCMQARPAEAIEFLEESLKLKPAGKGVELRREMLADIQSTCSM